MTSVRGEVSTDLSVLVGEMEALPCTSPSHWEGGPWHDDGEAKWYMMLMHDCWEKAGYVYPVCDRLATMILRNVGSGVEKVRCMNCGFVTREGQDGVVKVIGKVGGSGG